MKRKWKASVLGLALVSTTLTPATTSVAGAQTAGWGGFEVISAPSEVESPNGTNNSPAFSAAVSNDLGGGGVDLWVNNHALSSETLTDFIGGANVFSAVNRVTPTGSPNISDSHVGVFTDVDGDGDEDFIETAGRGDENRVFINSNGVLSETSNHGLEDPFARSRTVLNIDIDNDGDMDMLVGALDSRFNDEDGDGEPDVEPSTLFLNNGSGSFTEVADVNNVLFDENVPLTSGAQNVRFLSLTSTGPGSDQVIVVSNSFAFGVTTLQTGSGNVVEAATPVTQSLGADDNATQLREIVLGDLDGDLAPEWVAARQQDGLGEDDPDGNVITEISLPIGIGQVTEQGGPEALVNVSNSPLASNCRTVSLADFDNDADLDIFGGCAMLANGQTTNIVLVNDGAGNFTVDSSSVPATGAITSTVSLVADFNDDGWMDTYVGGGLDDEPGEDFIFLNEGGANNWLKIDLVGSNPDVTGAQVFVGTDKWQVRETGHRLHYGQDTSTLHFGLGTESVVAPVEIQWPDGTFESCSVAGINQTVTITQGSAACTAQTSGQFQAALDADPVIDTAGPVVTPSIPASASTIAPAVRAVAGTATDATDVERVRIRVRRNDGNGLDYWNGSAWTSSPAWVDVDVQPNGNWTLPNVDFGANGSYFVWGIGNDSLGNQSSAAQNGSLTFNVVGIADSAGPVVRPSAPGNGTTIAPAVRAVAGRATDATDVARVRIRVRRNDGNGLDYWNGSAWTSSPAWVDVDVRPNGNWILNDVDFGTAGSYFVWGIGNDSVGNQSSAAQNGKLTFRVG